jgi:hypothetical protein
MMNAQVPSWLPTLVFVPLIAFGLYRRLKRTFGRQPVTPRRMVARMVLLSAIAVFFVVWLPSSLGLIAAGCGLVAGVALALVGLAYTTFEVTAEGRFYTPNKWTGLAVTALFLGRLAARLLTFSERTAEVAAGGSPMGAMNRSPLTLGLFFLLAAYYVSYYAGVLRKTRLPRAGLDSTREAPRTPGERGVD